MKNLSLSVLTENRSWRTYAACARHAQDEVLDTKKSRTVRGYVQVGRSKGRPPLYEAAGEADCRDAGRAVKNNTTDIKHIPSFLPIFVSVQNKVIMNTLELEAYKAELAREVLSIDNKEVLDDIKEIILKGTGHNAPCRMNFSEVKQHLQASEKRFDAGEYISEEQMEELFNSLR